MIQFDSIFYSTEQQSILEDFSLTIKGKEFVVINGPSGVGKSTLLQLLVGAIKPDAGNIYVDGVDIHELTAEQLQIYRRSLGMIWQDFRLFPEKTVFENVAMTLEILGYEPLQIYHEVPDILDRLGLGSKLDYKASALSGGEKQRVAIARALVHKPSLIIADEPTGNLDPNSTTDILKILTEINAAPSTIIMVTHEQNLNHLPGHHRIINIEN